MLRAHSDQNSEMFMLLGDEVGKLILAFEEVEKGAAHYAEDENQKKKNQKWVACLRMENWPHFRFLLFRDKLT